MIEPVRIYSIDGVNEIVLRDNLPQTGFSDAKLRILTSSVGNMLAYAFLIPLLPTLVSMSQSGVTEAKVQFIIKSIMGYVGLITSSTALQKIIERMINRFKD